jgi:FkbM family methyltransferase
MPTTAEPTPAQTATMSAADFATLFRATLPGRLFADRPIGFVDIGARGGAHALIEPVAEFAAVLGFEPDEAECRRVRAEVAGTGRYARFDIEPVALADAPGERTLYRLAAPTNDSLLPPNAAYVERYAMAKWRVLGTDNVRTTTLDRVLFESRSDDAPWGEIIKIDTQGTEYEILRGAERTLAERCMAVVAEVSFCELYAGQKVFSEVEALLRRHGFSFYGFERQYNRSGKRLDKRTQWGRERTVQADAVFFKDPFSMGHGGAALDERQRCVLFVAALVLEYNDFALEIAGQAFAERDRAALRLLVERRSARPPSRTGDEVRALAQAVGASPDAANLIVGRYLDARRRLNDVYDVEPEHSG